jgi:hypothetical protein
VRVKVFIGFEKEEDRLSDNGEARRRVVVNVIIFCLGEHSQGEKQVLEKFYKESVFCEILQKAVCLFLEKALSITLIEIRRHII